MVYYYLNITSDEKNVDRKFKVYLKIILIKYKIHINVLCI